ncbi:hypothetical protein QFC19_001325 [Naganishia cerealis]|uniref:Uncharacterized protein n=1 Tax=Naganishia cerealis TaxID=610337 RepID=A0ACC2WI98_9TREE|nr:hypothetical protein QFC19_001325 [Naganishia cerealis]
MSGKSLRLAEERSTGIIPRQNLLDGFLGSTSENLIANLFESSHGMDSDIQLRLDELGPGDDGQERAEMTLDAVESLNSGPQTPTNPKRKAGNSTVPPVSSPLGKLFSANENSKASEMPSHGASRDNKGHDDLARTNAEEFDDLRRQMTAMKDGQERLEEMLKLLLPSDRNKR